MKKEKVEAIIQKLSNLRALACSSSIEDFVLSYLTILDSNPDTQPVIVERICNARQDIKRQVFFRVMDLFTLLTCLIDPPALEEYPCGFAF